MGRSIPFRLDASGDPVFPSRLVLPGNLSGWVVLSFVADALAPPNRPVLRIVTADGEEQIAVLPGAALGRAHWLGLIPSDAVEIAFSTGPGTELVSVRRRREAGLLLECLWRRPGNAFAALLAKAKGQGTRFRDIVRGGVAVTRVKNFDAWAATRHEPFAGLPSTLSVRCIILTFGADDEGVSRSIAALKRQTLPPGEVIVADTRSLGAPSEFLAGADALLVLHPGDELMPDALALLAAGLDEADLAYADEIGADGVARLKPDWSPDLALATGYVGRIALFSRRLIARMPSSPMGPTEEAADTLGIFAAALGRKVVHRPRPLATLGRAIPGGDRARLLERLLPLVSVPARPVLRGGSVDLLWPLPERAPLVSVIIPSRDRLDLIRTVCRGVLERSDYPALELIVVDNGSTDPDVLAFYQELARDLRVRIVAYPQEFNFAAMVNAGVEVARGQVVVLLNNDIGIRNAGWLGEMVRQAIRPEVGAVGAKLLFGDGRIQHVGVVVGLSGRAGHIWRRRPADTPGRLGRLRVAHEVSAVTAACLAVSRDKYLAVGGFDAEAFPVDFNDVDFCLRLSASGWKCVWTPAAELSHFESVSRGPSIGAKRRRFEREAARFTRRWLDVIRHDPFYHPALSLTTFGEDLE